MITNKRSSPVGCSRKLALKLYELYTISIATFYKFFSAFYFFCYLLLLPLLLTNLLPSDWLNNFLINKTYSSSSCHDYIFIIKTRENEPKGSFIYYVRKISAKLTFLNPWYAHARVSIKVRTKWMIPNKKKNLHHKLLQWTNTEPNLSVNYFQNNSIRVVWQGPQNNFRAKLLNANPTKWLSAKPDKLFE